ncbi:MAG: hypothetical protein PUB94_07705, partial [Oscillospiraceae bacterium]|nr:hypothetical protein [Oscillospiraceae bacterium]
MKAKTAPNHFSAADFCTLKTKQSRANGKRKHPQKVPRIWSSPRPISTAWLNVSLRLHLQPI